MKYVRYKSSPEKQVIIRDSKDPKYTEARKQQGNNSKSDAQHKEQKKTSDQHMEKKQDSKNDKSPADKNQNNKGKDDKKGKHPDENPHQ